MTSSAPSWPLLALAVAVTLGLSALVLRLAMTEAAAVTPVTRATSGRAGRRDISARRPRPGSDVDVDADTDADAGTGANRGQRLRRAAVVVNPTKFADVAKVRAEVEQGCRSHGWDAPLWLETTAQDPGTGQTQEAVREGVDLVCCLGGDGTVRTVGAALTGTDVPLGLLSGGTGNLLARNLKLPDSLRKALSVALSGRDARIDTCLMTVHRSTSGALRERMQDDDPSENVDLADAADSNAGGAGQELAREQHRFLVMAGLGFDAEVIAGVPERLKAQMGWPAYVVAGLRHLRGPQFVVDIQMDDGRREHRRVRSVMVGNVGRLQGGVMLLPDAREDDGIIDAMLLSPQGIVGWGAVVAQLTTRQRRGHSRVDYYTCREIRVMSDKPIQLQVDGDTLGSANGMTIVVDPASLLVRLPG